MTITNRSGHQRRERSDNETIVIGEPLQYQGHIIEYDLEVKSWILDGKLVGSISDLSRKLGLYRETHDIGLYLERNGYKFKKPFAISESTPEDTAEDEHTSSIIKKAAQFKLYGTGESEEHKNLKNFVSECPPVIGLSENMPKGKTEFPLPSGDKIDVLFCNEDGWIIVEVKPSTSPLEDITRGFFQCIKYSAVLEACLAINKEGRNVRSVLVLGGSLPNKLAPLKSTLSNIQIFENIVPE